MHSFGTQVQVPGSLSNMMMPQQLLYQLYIGAIVYKVGCKAVPYSMDGIIFMFQSYFGKGILHDVLYGTHRILSSLASAVK